MRHRYSVYGVSIASDMPLALPDYSGGHLGDVECLSRPASFFLAAVQGVAGQARSDPWYRYAALDDGSTYVRWENIGEFLVANDGRRIMCRCETASSFESFQVYMLGQALSFALVKQGLEPLHATVVAVGDHAVAFLGSHALGKSTLAACFLDAGHRLLTDDLFVMRRLSDGVLAYPGPARIKLFPKVASRFFAHAEAGVKMNADTNKLILPLDEARRCAYAVPLKAIYTLAGPGASRRQSSVRVERLSPREAFVELVKGTFNYRLVGRQRLARQFAFMTSLAEFIPVKQLTYPRSLERLAEVRQAVLADLADNGIVNGDRRCQFPSASA
jgi:hypothetical protein